MKGALSGGEIYKCLRTDHKSHFHLAFSIQSADEYVTKEKKLGTFESLETSLKRAERTLLKM
ncbi:MAG: hypothetical protein ACE5HY_06450 [Candidatus Hydrothermarchaeales archaeon]